ncbi:hypothetical protein LCGC14_1790810, partial [marine sediment metagenome]
MVSKKQLQNLARGRAIRKANLMAQQKVRQPQPRRKVRYIRFPRNQPILNPRLMSDLDVTTTDNNFNKQKETLEIELKTIDQECKNVG